MSETRRDDARSQDEQAFVDRLSEAYRAPELPPSKRVAFREGLDRRLAKGARARRWRTAGLLAAGALAVTLVWLGSASLPGLPDAAPETTLAAAEPADAETIFETPAAIEADTTPEEALLSFVYEPLSDEATSLPDDYEAIESLFLGS